MPNPLEYQEMDSDPELFGSSNHSHVHFPTFSQAKPISHKSSPPLLPSHPDHFQPQIIPGSSRDPNRHNISPSTYHTMQTMSSTHNVPSTHNPSSIHSTISNEHSSPVANLPWNTPIEIGTGKTGLVVRKRELERMMYSRKWENELVEKGVKGLGRFCMTVINNNASRIWDVGDTSYDLIEDLLKSVSREQLQEIENNSPNLKKQSDWIWELYYLQDFPSHWEKARMKGGQPRTSGWRRKYHDAVSDEEARKANAASKMAEKYQAMEKERSAKKIQVVDKMVLPKGKGPRGIPWRGVGPKPISSSNGSHGGGTASNAIAKAKLEVQRTRIAMTNVAGRPLPSSIRLAPPRTSNTTRIPTLPDSSRMTNHQSTRLPPPPKSIRQSSVKANNYVNHLDDSSSPERMSNNNKKPLSHIPMTKGSFDKSIHESGTRLKSMDSKTGDKIKVPEYKPISKSIDFFAGLGPKSVNRDNVQSMTQILPKVSKMLDGQLGKTNKRKVSEEGERMILSDKASEEISTNLNNVTKMNSGTTNMTDVMKTSMTNTTNSTNMTNMTNLNKGSLSRDESEKWGDVLFRKKKRKV
ncbi:hypothetical protein M231_02349 [Tremella mesenterica]|uniref:Elongin-A n=1 Tax=Tremella mesenterica TaxID=5217 RepID=A0A4Q1BQZ6_TREME|nr:hypothetical protein M231_02349 [Tremella mesenterica]